MANKETGPIGAEIMRGNKRLLIYTPEEKKAEAEKQAAIDLEKRKVRAEERKAEAMESGIGGSTTTNNYHGDYNHTEVNGDNFGNASSGRSAKQDVHGNTVVAKNDLDSGSSININTTKPSFDTEGTPAPVEPNPENPASEPEEPNPGDDSKPKPSAPEAGPGDKTEDTDKPKEEKGDDGVPPPLEEPSEKEKEPTLEDDQEATKEQERLGERYKMVMAVPNIKPVIQSIAEKYIKARRLDSIRGVRFTDLEGDSDFHDVMAKYRYAVSHNWIHDQLNKNSKVPTREDIEAFLTKDQIKQENDIKKTIIRSWEEGSVVRRIIHWTKEHPVLSALAVGGAVTVVGVATGGFGLAGIAGSSLGAAMGIGAVKGGIFGFLGSRQDSKNAAIHGAWSDDNNPEGHTSDERRRGQYLQLADALFRCASEGEILNIAHDTVSVDAHIISESAYRDRTKNRAKTVGGVAAGAIIGAAVSGITYGLTHWQHSVAHESTQATSTPTIENKTSPLSAGDMRVDYYQNSSGYTGANTEETLINNLKNLGLDSSYEEHVRGLFHDAVSRVPDSVYSGGNVANTVGTLNSPGNEAARWIIDDVLKNLSNEGAFGTHEVVAQGVESVVNYTSESVLSESARNIANIATGPLTAAVAFAFGNQIARNGAADHPTAVGGPYNYGYSSTGQRGGNGGGGGSNARTPIPPPVNPTEGPRPPETPPTTDPAAPAQGEAGQPQGGEAQSEEGRQSPEDIGIELTSEQKKAIRRAEEYLTDHFHNPRNGGTPIEDVTGSLEDNQNKFVKYKTTITGAKAELYLTSAGQQRLVELMQDGVVDFKNETNLRRLFDTTEVVTPSSDAAETSTAE